MADLQSDATQRLLKAFMKFRKTGWHDKKIGDFNPSEFRVLSAIKQGTEQQNCEIKVSEISQILKVTTPTVTQILNTLERDGLIERTIDHEDRRAVKIKLTPSGVEATINARKAFTESFQGLIDYLGEEESVQLANLLMKVHHYFDQLAVK